jgi:hypothetical protein
VSRSPLTRAAALACALLTVGLSGCATGWEQRVAPVPVGAAEAGFVPTPTPTPEATVSPRPGSWDGIAPAPGYRVVLVRMGDDTPTRTLVSAVEDWAAGSGVALRTVRVEHDPIAGLVEGMELNGDLIVSVGDGLVDALATVSANHLDRQFLVVGAEIAEPTANVTAVDWTGAGYRGEGLGTAAEYDAGSFTPERASEAVRAGAAAVLSGLTGVVLWID